MSLKSMLMPAVTAWWLSPARRQRLRASAERRRIRQGQVHTVQYFHQADDPYSALMVQCLPSLLARYDIALDAHVVSPPSDAAAPDRERLIAYSRKDAAWLAQQHGLTFVDPGHQPSTHALDHAVAACVMAIEQGTFVAQAQQISTSLWATTASGTESQTHAPEATTHAVQAHLQASDACRERSGHYSGGMLYYAGEWYWGLDRLHHLESRLQALGAARPGTNGFMFAPEAATHWPQLDEPAVVDFFFSFRSPYSHIAAFRLFALTRETNIQVRLRYVLPMVMRGLVVPRNKRMYISQDAAREAERLGIDFGRICDPVGRPTERGLSLMPLAESHGLGQAYVLSFMRGVWSEGLDAGSDRDLRTITDRAGLLWTEVCIALEKTQWRKTAEINRQEMLNLGLWGVPSFRLDDTAVWGQDRLSALEQTLRQRRHTGL
jgi:2-hydroxychromene-2-carboxylate isomerase